MSWYLIRCAGCSFSSIAMQNSSATMKSIAIHDSSAHDCSIAMFNSTATESALAMYDNTINIKHNGSINGLLLYFDNGNISC